MSKQKEMLLEEELLKDTSREGLERLRLAVLPLAMKVASHYAENEEDIAKLADVALSKVKYARRRYLRRFEGSEPRYKFSTYLTYFLKRGIEEALEE